MLFHISTTDKLRFLTPMIPHTSIFEPEDREVARVCFAPSINCCLRSICLDMTPIRIDWGSYDKDNDSLVGNQVDMQKLKMMVCPDVSTMVLKNYLDFLTKDFGEHYPLYHAYVPTDIKYNEIYVPSKDEVFDVEHTREVWIKKPCTVKKVFSFIVTGSVCIGTWQYADRNGTIHDYDIRDYSYTIVPDDTAKVLKKLKDSTDKAIIRRAKLEQRIEKLEMKISNHTSK